MKTKMKPTDLDRYVGARINTLRLARGVSQTELGDKLGVTFQQVQKTENGTNRCSAGRLGKIALFFGVPVQEFFPPEYGDGKQLDIFHAEIVKELNEIGDSVVALLKRIGRVEA